MTSLAHGLALSLGADPTPGIGPAGAATFILAIENGARVTYEWKTEVRKMWGGLEQRISRWTCPQLSFDCSAYLADGDDRNLRSQLVSAAAAGSAFLLALPFEEATITADASGTTVPVTSTAGLDWALAGQRVVCIGPDGTTSAGVVQLTTGTTIVLDVAPGTAGKRGGRIMPTMAVYLDPQQGFGRHPVNLELWQIKARAALFGFAGSDAMGAGAALTTFDGLNVFDRGLELEGTAMDSMQSMSEIVDLGGVLSSAGAASVPDWGREVKIESEIAATFQWWKKFVSAVRGSQVAFLLPSWRPDFVFVSKISNTTIKIASGSVAGAGDITKWFGVSAAHKYLQVTNTSGLVMYVKISSVTDNLDGTVTVIATVPAFAGIPAVISWMELVHFNSDVFELGFQNSAFAVASIARVVQR